MGCETFREDYLCPISDVLMTKAFKTPCKHTFHQHALLEWLITKSNCPTCREPVSYDTLTVDEIVQNEAKKFALDEDTYTPMDWFLIKQQEYELIKRYTEFLTELESRNEPEDFDFLSEMRKIPGMNQYYFEKFIQELNSVSDNQMDKVVEDNWPDTPDLSADRLSDILKLIPDFLNLYQYVVQVSIGQSIKSDKTSFSETS